MPAIQKLEFSVICEHTSYEPVSICLTAKESLYVEPGKLIRLISGTAFTYLAKGLLKEVGLYIFPLNRSLL